MCVCVLLLTFRWPHIKAADGTFAPPLCFARLFDNFPLFFSRHFSFDDCLHSPECVTVCASMCVCVCACTAVCVCGT